MFASFEEKGKIYTNVISKHPVDVVIQTTTHFIHGQIHIRPDDRILDEINEAKEFLAVTDAIVKNSNAEVIYRTKFIAVSRHQIVWVIPTSEMQRVEEEA